MKRRRGKRALRRGQRQAHAEQRAASGAVVHRDLAAVQAHDLLHQAQPEPGAGPGGVHAVEGLEDMHALRRGNARPVVDHVDMAGGIDPHHHAALAARMVDGVLHEVGQRARQRIAVALRFNAGGLRLE
jgi:hypothetical protein